VKGRAGAILTAAVLLAVGFLLGSFWLQWRHARLGESGSSAEVGGVAVPLPEGFASRVRVEVLNGLGEPGAAEKAAARLRAMGFDVVYFGNAPSFGHEHTQVLARSKDRAAARRVADSLGLDSALVRPDSTLYLDASVILGSDWHSVLNGGSRDPGRDREKGNLLERLLERVHR
jgi:hypothetical protein